VSKSASLFLSSQIRFIFKDTRRLILEDSETQRVVIGKIARLLTIECDGRARPWLELELGELAGFRDGFLEFRFGARRFYLPFGWNGWTVAKRVHLVRQRNGVVYNHRVRWHIGDRWATPRQPYVTASESGLRGRTDDHDY
jgi:hypothetical protein